MKRKRFRIVLDKERKYCYQEHILGLFKGILKSKAVPVCMSEGKEAWIEFKVGIGFEEVFKEQIQRYSFKVIEVIKAVP